MENEELSVIVWCWLDLPTNTTQLRVVSAVRGEEVHLKEATFLLRISIDAKASVARCYIRHMTSGREANVQGSPKLRSFVEECLLNVEQSTSQEPGVPEKPET